MVMNTTNIIIRGGAYNYNYAERNGQKYKSTNLKKSGFANNSI